MNYFTPKTSAERYAKGRPDFHDTTIHCIKEFLNIDRPLDKVLDIACGTGLSTKALLAIATNVFGTDISQEMLNLAPHRDKIKYSIAPAEQQPFPDNSFDLITVSSGVHWFDVDKFLKEAKRLMKSNSWLVLYDNYFLSEMEGNNAFSNWYPDVYVKKFPVTPRNDKYDWSNENLNQKNLEFVAEKTFKNPVAMSKRQLISYLTSQSNILASVETGKVTFEEAEHWLNKELSAFYPDDNAKHTCYFGNWVKFIKRAS